MPRVYRSICAPLGCVVVASGIVGFVIVHSPERVVPMPYYHTVLLVVAALAYIKAITLFNLYHPHPRRVAELAYAVHAEVCRYRSDSPDGELIELRPTIANMHTASLLIHVQNGAAIIYCVAPGEQPSNSRHFIVEPSGRIQRCRGDEDWRAAPLVPQLNGLRIALGSGTFSPVRSWARREDH